MIMTRFIVISVLVHLLGALLIFLASKDSLPQWQDIFNADTMVENVKNKEEKVESQPAPKNVSVKKQQKKVLKRKPLKKTALAKSKSKSKLKSKSIPVQKAKKRMVQKSVLKEKPNNTQVNTAQQAKLHSSLDKKDVSVESLNAEEEVKSFHSASSSELPQSSIKNPIPKQEMFNETSPPADGVGMSETPPNDEDIPLIPKEQSIQHSLQLEKANGDLDDVAQVLPQKDVPLPSFPQPSEKENLDLSENFAQLENSKKSPAKPVVAKKPKIIKNHQSLRAVPGNPQPNYPKIAQKKNQEGSVLLLYFVDDSGLVEQMQLLESSGYPALDNEALRTLSRQQYLPGQSGWYRHRIDFKLKNLKQNS